MKLSQIFDKSIERSIEGVIKADDESSLKIELEEYVLTNEVKKQLEDFLDSYKDTKNANGVWISGFYGSGKSHLLKILALLFENRVIEGKSVLDYIIPKCLDNEILIADLRKAVSIPSRSILFNIDQKADVISKQDIDALLAVFVKVFDEASGYYSKQPYIAQFERDLDQDNLLEKFKVEYKNVSGFDWENGRKRVQREADNIDKAYSNVTGKNVTEVMESYSRDYRLSIEDFADQVKAYIDSQGNQFRLNFFVDEVGQYIADNTKLMTNLQTIAETLSTKCKGRAWIIVTAQEDMDNVIGQMTQKQGNDFTKIQARFKIRLKLTSTDVAEVIQKRLLLKNDNGVEILESIYKKEINNLKTLFDFSDGSHMYKNFQNRDHFIHSYPFIPYQYSLFQSSIINLSAHNAFEGKHSSVGERSMLGVFHEVIKNIQTHEVGKLATFDLMFSGIRTVLKSQIQKSILSAEKHLDDEFAKKVLKALFLVKYVREFKATVRNICVLMTDDFDIDLNATTKRIQEALAVLEQQTYIQRNGEIYTYLTDEEKDVEQEIKNTNIDKDEITNTLDDIIFNQIIRDKKIRYPENNKDYPFARKLDNKMLNREQELSIHCISQFSDESENENKWKMESMAREELLVLLPQNDRIIRDLYLYKQTEKYVNQNIKTSQQESINSILKSKGEQNIERLRDIGKTVRELMSKSKMFLYGREIEHSSQDPQLRIQFGFQQLIAQAYPNLKMLQGISYSEAEVGNIIKQAQNGLFGNDATSLSESEQEVFSFIQSNTRLGIRSTVKNVQDKFSKKPYGWYYEAILCHVAKLHARGKIEIRHDSNLMEGDGLQAVILNTSVHPNLMLDPLVDISASEIKQLKDFYDGFFHSMPSSNEAKTIGKEVATKINDLHFEISALVQSLPDYPFLSSLKSALGKIQAVKGKQYQYYFSGESKALKDELLDCKEDTIDPIVRFLNSPQREIYDNARKMMESSKPNLGYIESKQSEPLSLLLSQADCYKGNRIQEIKNLSELVKSALDAKIQSEVELQKQKVLELKSKLTNTNEFTTLSSSIKENFDKKFDEVISKIEKETLIAMIRDTVSNFSKSIWQDLHEKIQESNPKKDSGSGSSSSPTQYKAIRDIDVRFEKLILADEADIDNYLSMLRKAILEEIQKGNKVRV